MTTPTVGTDIEALAAHARELTLRRFGRTVHLFSPLYLSNECVSTCTYCGFSAANTDITRRTLSPEEVRAEAAILTRRGFRHLLLVSGEHPRIVSRDYLCAAIEALAPDVPQLSLEVQTWDTPTYGRFLDAGCDGVVIYQETYDRDVYAATHLKGRKRNYARRLEAPAAAAAAGMRRIGLGVLLGLAPDWRADVDALVAHARDLQRRYWRSEFTVALPRLRPCAGGIAPQAQVSDDEYVEALCRIRVALPEAGIVLSTRESPVLRDGLARICVTHMSAGSATEPGGYSAPREAEPQFEVDDRRSPAEVASVLRTEGLDPVWKDWLRPRGRDGLPDLRSPGGARRG